MELHGALNHLKYEFEMLLATARLIEAGGMPIDLGNAVLESWVLHVRNFIDFFYSPKLKDDIVISDFLRGENWRNEFPAISRNLEEAKERANKEMAHLTYSRIGKTQEEKLWAVGQLTNQLVERMETFADLVGDNEIASSLKSLLPKGAKLRLVIAPMTNTSGFSDEATIVEPPQGSDPQSE